MASASAIRLASVPEFVNRTCSIDGEPSDDQLGEANLDRDATAPIAQPPSSCVDGRAHGPWRVPEQSGGVVAEQVDVPMTVDVDQYLPSA